MTSHSSSELFFSVNVEQAELDAILQRIDENLALRSVLQTTSQEQAHEPVAVAAPPVYANPMPEQLAQLGYLQAPFFVRKGRRPAELLKSVLNIPIRIFGYKQGMFNRDLLALLKNITEYLQHLREYAGPQGRLDYELARLNTALHTLNNQSSSQFADQQDKLTQLAADLHGLHRWLEQTVADMRGQNDWLTQVAADARGQQTVVEQLAVDVRGQHDWLAQVVADARGQQAAVEQLAVGARGQHDWLTQVVADTRGQQTAVEQLAADAHGQHDWLTQVAADVRGQQTAVEQLAADAHGQHDWLTQVAADVRGQQAAIEQLAADAHGQHDWLIQVVADARGQSEWIRVLQRKVQMLALDVRDSNGNAVNANQGIAEPRIIDLEAYTRKLKAMDGVIRVNLGSGEKPLAEYINVDFRELPDTDVVANIQRLPFEPESVAEINTTHLVEHFREHQLRTQVIPYWKSLLQPNGILRIVCPNWEAMLRRLHAGQMSLAEFKLLTFGGQDYEGDDHFAMYTPETLSALLKECGFTRIDVVATERMNDFCPEQELLAYR